MIKPLVLMIIVVTLAACSAPGATKKQRSSFIDDMKTQTLLDLYKVHPDSRAEIKDAPGYAVFSNVGISLGLVSLGNGFGVVTGNQTNKKTYMKMGELGAGVGLGIKDFRAVFIFQNSNTMNRFINSGWTFGGHLDAAAKADEKGVSMSEGIVIGGIKIYQLTESGLSLRLNVTGTKYWQDRELNYIQQPREPAI
jgi:lipid-binding SYLF domain-containing protein